MCVNMAEIFRSKEVYKQIRDADNKPKIIPVRNMYVAGAWLTPVYMDHYCTILSMSSNEPNVVDFTTETQKQTDHDGHLNIITVEADSVDQKISWYTTASTNQTDHNGHLNIITVEADSVNQKIDWYYKSTENPSDKEGHLNIITLDVPSTKPSLIIYDKIGDSVGHDCGVRILSMSSNEPIIVDSST